MIKSLRIKITAWTATFNNIYFKTSYLLSYEIPPLSTLLGLIMAAKGDIIKNIDFGLGYEFSHKTDGWDLQTYYKQQILSRNSNKQGIYSVFKKNILYDTVLYLYITNTNYGKYFKYPAFPLYLGQKQDIATVETIEEIMLVKTGEGIINKTIIPLEEGCDIGGVPEIMPIKIDYETRKLKKIKPFITVKEPCFIKSSNIYQVKGENKFIYLYSSDFFA